MKLLTHKLHPRLHSLRPGDYAYPAYDSKWGRITRCTVVSIHDTTITVTGTFYHDDTPPTLEFDHLGRNEEYNLTLFTQGEFEEQAGYLTEDLQE